MSAEDKLKEIISFLKFEIPFEKEFVTYLDEIYTYMKYNDNSPLKDEFFDEYFNVVDGIRNQLIELNDVLQSGIIKNEEFRKAFVLSRIPFKCPEQYFFYKMIAVLNNDNKSDTDFGVIVEKLNRYAFFNSIDTRKLLDNIGDKYNGNLPINFYGENRKKEIKMRDYQNHIKTINDPRNLTDEERNVVGYRGELYYKENYKPQDGRILVWNSQDVDGFAHIDFLEYNYKDDHLIPHEIKTTVTNDDLNIATISAEEFKYLYETLNQKNVTYFLHRYQFTPDLNTLRDSARFEIYDKDHAIGFNKDETLIHAFDLNCIDNNKNYKLFYSKIPYDNIYREEYDNVKKLILK